MCGIIRKTFKYFLVMETLILLVVQFMLRNLYKTRRDEYKLLIKRLLYFGKDIINETTRQNDSLDPLRVSYALTYSTELK